MKNWLAVIATIPCCLNQAFADTIFRGTLQFDATQSCNNQRVGADYQSILYLPMEGNFNKSSISTVYSHGMFGYTLENGAFTKTFKNVSAINYGYYLGTYIAQVRVTSMSPATVTPTTASVVLKGQIRGAGQDSGVGGKPCVVTFTGVYLRDK